MRHQEIIEKLEKVLLRNCTANRHTGKTLMSNLWVKKVSKYELTVGWLQGRSDTDIFTMTKTKEKWVKIEDAEAHYLFYGICSFLKHFCDKNNIPRGRKGDKVQAPFQL